MINKEQPKSQKTAIPRRTFLKKVGALTISIQLVDLMTVHAARHDEYNCHPNPNNIHNYHAIDQSCAPGPFGAAGVAPSPEGTPYEEDESCGGISSDKDQACGGLDNHATPQHDLDGNCGRIAGDKDESCRSSVHDHGDSTITDTDETRPGDR